MRKRFTLLLALTLLLLAAQPLATAQGHMKVPDAPVQMIEGGGDVSINGTSDPGGVPGTWYLGATPPNVDNTKPVLLFVHGKGSSAQTWWGETTYHGTNDMYTYAYNNGYRTAFVDLHPDLDMWANGSMLNGLIDTIRSHFGVSKLTIIAHSKGGVDSNAALAHYGAKGKISRVVTLGSPHWGTPLADLAYSSWTWWLAEIFGERNDATYVMQTGYMNYFRSVTDGKDTTTPFSTLSGYKCGPVFSAMWYSCSAISGEDDGVVPVWSTRIPGGTHLKEGYWDHDEIKMGSRTWSYFAPVIKTASVHQLAELFMEGKLAAADFGRATDAGRKAPATAPGNLILRGGNTVTAQAPDFAVESGVTSATFTFYASGADFTATLTGPDGSTHNVTVESQVPGDQIFGGTWAGAIKVDAPAAGMWSLSAAAGEQAGYMMVASLESDLTATLDAGQSVSAPGGSRNLAVGFAGTRIPTESKAQGIISLTGDRQSETVEFAAVDGRSHKALVRVPGVTGIYNATVTVTGTLADGSRFERTLAGSFAAVPLAERGHWTGR